MLIISSLWKEAKQIFFRKIKFSPSRKCDYLSSMKIHKSTAESQYSKISCFTMHSSNLLQDQSKSDPEYKSVFFLLLYCIETLKTENLS